MKCPACHAENRGAARFCLHCGGRLEKACPRCHHTLLPQARFCDQCGLSLEAPSESIVDYDHPRSYTPTMLAEKIINHREAVEGERKLVTVLFADVVDFTSISERLDPEDVHRLMDRCFRLLMDEVHRYEGAIIQFTGDGIMALFGAPIANEDHAIRACHAALAIRETMRLFGREVKSEWGVDFFLRVGLNSGLVIVGTIGDDLRMDYTAIGDTINLASRIEKEAAPGTIFSTHNTQKLVRAFFEFIPKGKLSVKGKGQPVEAYELAGVGTIDTRLEAAAAKGLTRFVGREREIEGLTRALEKVESGTGQVIGLVGEAGVGKSRLALQFHSSLDHERYTYLEGRCLHFGASMAYLPILDILKSYFAVAERAKETTIKKQIKERLAALGNDLGHLVSPFYELLSLSVSDEPYLKLEPRQRRERIFEALRDFFVRLSQEKPVIVVIEDLHWVDKTSEDFLTYLIGCLANSRILLIVLYRPDYTHPWTNRSYYSRLWLDELPLAARYELLKSLLPEAPVTEPLRDFVIKKAGGNPLFIEELTCALQEKGHISKGTDGYMLTGRAAEIQVPDTVQGIIAARIDRLEEELKRIVQIASVIGREFSFSILESIADTKQDLKEALQRLEALEFIYEESLFPELRYVFKHALVQDVAYNSLLLKKRRSIHEKIGLGIERLYRERLEEFYEVLAYHYSTGENSAQACRYLKLSGIKATNSSALWEAFRFFSDALNLLRAQPSTPEYLREQIEVRLLMASPMLSLGFPEPSLDILQQGEKLCKDAGDTRCLVTLLSMIGLYHSLKGNPLLGVRYNEDCLRVAQQQQDVDLLAPVAFDLCSNYAARGEFLKLASVAPPVLAAIEGSKKQSDCFDRGYNVYTALSAFYAFSIGYMGNFAGAKDIFEKGLSSARQIENLYSIGLTETLFGYLYCHQGNGKKALAHFREGINYLERGQIFVLLGLAWSGIGWSYYFMNEAKTGLPYVEKGLKIHSDAGISYDLSVHYYFLGVIHSELGNLELAHTYVEQALKLAQKYNEIYYVALSLPVLGRVLAHWGKGPLKEAEECVLRGINLLENLKVKPQVGIAHLCLADVYARSGNAEKVVKSLRRAEEIFRETGMDYWLARTTGYLGLLGV